MLEVAKPALIGGEPVFSPPLPMARPKLPPYAELHSTFQKIVESGHLTKGPELANFESESKLYLGADDCVGVSSCTSGLMLCLQALKRRLPQGMEPLIAVPSFTFLASVTAIVWCGFRPVFVESEPASMNICLQDLRRVFQEQSPCAVLAVHCFGNPVPSEPLQNLCSENDTKLIFDAAHGFGATHKGQKVGQDGWCQVFSLTPTKMVVAGEGGLIATNDPQLAEELRVGREYGNDGNYDTRFPGLNARLSELHAALARRSLGMLDNVVADRNRIAGLLRASLGEIPGIGFQQLSPNSTTTYKDFTITIDQEAFGLNRDHAAKALLAEGIPSRKYFSPPCHQHKAFSQFSNRQLPQTEQLASRCLSIPLLEESSVPGITEAFAKLQKFSGQLG